MLFENFKVNESHVMRKLEGGEMNRPDLQTFRELPKIPVVVLLNDLRSRLNLGSIFRSADAFLIEKLLLCGITDKPPHREIQKSALGATESVNWEYFSSATDIAMHYRLKGYMIVAVEQTEGSVPLGHFKFQDKQPYILILGNELEGVSEDLLRLSDVAVEIPQGGTKHSLNVAVSAGIVLNKAFEQLHK